MADSATVRRVRELAAPICDELGLFLWDVKYEKEGATWYLRVYIDSDDGITLDDCEAVHRPLDKLLDETDPIAGGYVFEVSSPGLGRKLERKEHFEVCIGDEVLARYIRPQEGVREVRGVLEDCDWESGIITLAEEDGKKAVNLHDCAYVKLTDDENLF